MANITVTFNWTRGEFSAGATSELFENTANNFATATKVWTGDSATVSTAIAKTVGATPYYYWLRHVLQDTTAGTEVAVTSPPVTYVA